jgi:hypothetical protein
MNERNNMDNEEAVQQVEPESEPEFEPEFVPGWRDFAMGDEFIMRVMPEESSNPWLRFQVGKKEQRMQKFPVFANRASKKIVNWIDGGTTDVFSLFGWGDTWAAAEAMARINGKMRREKRSDTVWHNNRKETNNDEDNSRENEDNSLENEETTDQGQHDADVPGDGEEDRAAEAGGEGAQGGSQGALR